MSTVIILLVFAIGVGLFTDLLFFALGDPHTGEVEDGRILSHYGETWLNRYTERKAQIMVEQARREMKWNADHCNNTPPDFRRPVYNPPNWWKLLVCPRCFNTWASIAAFVVLAFAIPLTGWWLLMFVPFTGFASLALSASESLR